MELIEDIAQIKNPFQRAVVTIGNFDGVHIGHQTLFQTVIQKARAINGTAVGITFEPHPMRALKKNGPPPLITLYEQKIELIAATGIDVLVGIPFTPAFAAITARDFLEKILIGQIGMQAMVVGRDYSFGQNREGNLAMLQDLAPRLGFEVLVCDWIKPSPDIPDRISSTHIRELIMAGRMNQARRRLGRYYQIRGQVVSGRNRGARLLDCPTANIHLQDELCPQTGIYAVTVEYGGKTYMGVANIGYSPTFDDKRFTVEVHLIDYHNGLYGEKIRVNFVERLRDEIKFSSVAELSRQIQKDIGNTRERLRAALA